MVETTHPLILLVEDNDADYETTKRAFNKANLANTIHRCADGDEAIDYLIKDGKTRFPLPNIILLDLNLPGTDGIEVLSIIKNHEHLHNIPVIVLTTSVAEEDIERCYHYGANSYIQKPVDIGSFIDSIQRLNDFWFEVAVLPKI